ncbi:MAG: arsenate reductase ArsC [Dehalococcoidia bacterium]
MDKIRVLFLCTGNSARSQMAEAFLRKYAGDKFEAYSAGLEPTGIHPLTKKVMDEIGIDISKQKSKSLSEYMGKLHFAYLITVCLNADKNCPSTFVGFGQRQNWDIEDPVAFSGTDAEKLQKFRDTRDQISEKVRTWTDNQIKHKP